jgi:cysteine synthase A
LQYVHEGLFAAIGNTPLIELRRLFSGASFRVFAKLEGLNAGGSSKDRPAFRIIREAMLEGLLSRDSVVVESSSGNMGIGLAQACKMFGLTFVCVVDPRAARQNLRIIRAYGATIDYVTEPDPETGDFLTARLNRVRQLIADNEHAFWPNQYANAHNAGSHYASTIQEIVHALDGRLDYLFCAVSTCGTIRGCAQYLRERKLPVKVVAVDAVGSVIFPGGERGKRLIPGLGAGIQPPLNDPSLIDEVVYVSDEDCVVGCRQLAGEEAILAGGSSGGVVRAVQKLAGKVPRGAVCAAILPDRGERYLETVFSDQWVRENLGTHVDLWQRQPALEQVLV